MRASRTAVRLVCLLLCLVFCVGALAACAPKLGTPYLTLGNETLTVNMYELMLSRMRGQLYSNQYPVNESRFWTMVWNEAGQTYEDYFNAEVLRQCRQYLAAWYMYTEVYGLSLSAEDYASVDEYLDGLLYTDADGNRTQFNRILAAYGVNMDILREVYLVETRITHLKDHLSSIIADTVRSEYYTSNYACFLKLVKSSYALVYEKDSNGDEIRYTDETFEHIAYDKENGTVLLDGNNNPYADEHGDAIYYYEDTGRIAYDTENGVRNNVDEDGDSVGDYVAYDDETLAGIKAEAESLYAQSKTLSAEEFRTLAKEHSDKFSSSDEGNGAFLNLSVYYSAELLSDVADGLKTVQPGETAFVETDEGYYILRRLHLPENGWSDKANESWFSDFETAVVEKMYDTLTRDYMDRISENDKVRDKLPSIANVGTNWLGTTYY